MEQIIISYLVSFVLALVLVVGGFWADNTAFVALGVSGLTVATITLLLVI